MRGGAYTTQREEPGRAGELTCGGALRQSPDKSEYTNCDVPRESPGVRQDATRGWGTGESRDWGC